MPEVGRGVCVICGYKKDYSEQLRDPRPICLWCDGPMFSQMLSSLDEEVTSEVANNPTVDCERNDFFHFLSDLGELAASHPHLLITRDLVSVILTNIQGQRRVNFYSIRGSIPFDRLIPILSYLESIGLIRLELEEEADGTRRIQEITIPDGSLIQKAFLTIEASVDWSEHREPNLILAYVLIKGLSQTIDIIHRNGVLNVGEGITRLYLHKGRVFIPRQFAAPLAFVVGKWAGEQDQFTETEIKSFMAARGLSSIEREKAVRALAGTSPGMRHSVYRLERYPYGDGTQSFRFALNPRYAGLRERLRGRFRDGRGA